MEVLQNLQHALCQCFDSTFEPHGAEPSGAIGSLGGGQLPEFNHSLHGRQAHAKAMSMSGPQLLLLCLQACISVHLACISVHFICAAACQNHDLVGLLRLQGKAGCRTITNMQQQAHWLNSLERGPRHRATQPSALATLMRLCAAIHGQSRRIPATLSITAIEPWLILRCAFCSMKF